MEHFLLLLLVVIIAPGTHALVLSNNQITLSFADCQIVSLATATEVGAVNYTISGDSWAASLAPIQGAAARVLGPSVCSCQNIAAEGQKVVVSYGGAGCSPYAVTVEYELQQNWHFATKTLFLQSEDEQVRDHTPMIEYIHAVLLFCSASWDLRFRVPFL